MMQIFSWTLNTVITAIIFSILGVSAESDQTAHNVVIKDCDQRVTQCARQFKKVVTVYEHNTTIASVNWVTTSTLLPPTTVTSTSVVVVTSINTTETSGLCEDTIVVTIPGTSTVTVHLNATSVKSIIPRTTTTRTDTITQWEMVTSECLLKGSFPFPTPFPNGQGLPPQVPLAAHNGSVATPELPLLVRNNSEPNFPKPADPVPEGLIQDEVRELLPLEPSSSDEGVYHTVHYTEKE